MNLERKWKVRILEEQSIWYIESKEIVDFLYAENEQEEDPEGVKSKKRKRII